MSHLGSTLRAAAARAASAILAHGARVEDQLERIGAGALEAPWRGAS